MDRLCSKPRWGWLRPSDLLRGAVHQPPASSPLCLSQASPPVSPSQHPLPEGPDRSTDTMLTWFPSRDTRLKKRVAPVGEGAVEQFRGEGGHREQLLAQT